MCVVVVVVVVVVVNGSGDDVELQRAALHGSILSIAGQNWYFKAMWNLFSIFWDKTGISGHRVRSWLPSIITSLKRTWVRHQ